MNNKNQRVLGRILAVEETVAVSGARPTSPAADNGTFPPSDTGYAYDIIPADEEAIDSLSIHNMNI